jgi:hypothetical protein
LFCRWLKFGERGGSSATDFVADVADVIKVRDGESEEKKEEIRNKKVNSPVSLSALSAPSAVYKRSLNNDK